MSEPRPILILDFDGVVCDSTEECVVAAWNARQADRGLEELVRAVEEVPEPYRGTLCQLRKYVRTAGEYHVAFVAAEEGLEIATRADFDRHSRRLAEGVTHFAPSVFAARGRLRDADQDHWIDLHRVYPGFRDQLHRIWPRFEVFVVTGKDGETVRIFWQRFDLELADDHLFDRDAARDKLRVVEGIARRRGEDLERVHVLDDNVDHLLPLRQAGCRTLMATWGYHTKDDLVQAKRHGIRRVALGEWISVLLADASVRVES